jgi:hypothetical protein
MLNRPQNPCRLIAKFESIKDHLLYQAIIELGGFTNAFNMIIPSPENVGFKQPPFDNTTDALLYELVMAIHSKPGGGGGGGGTVLQKVDEFKVLLAGSTMASGNEFYPNPVIGSGIIVFADGKLITTAGEPGARVLQYTPGSGLIRIVGGVNELEVITIFKY